VANRNDNIWALYDNLAFTRQDPSAGGLDLKTTQTIPYISIGGIAWDKDGNFAYANSGSLHCFRVQPSLSFVEQPSSPYIVPNIPGVPLIHPSGDWIYIGNGSALYVFERDSATGALRQIQVLSSSVANIVMTPDGHYLLGADWLERKIASYRIDQIDGTLALASVIPERGPIGPVTSTLTMHPGGQFVVQTINSGNGLNPPFPGEISVFHLDSDSGMLSETAGSPFPAGVMPFTSIFDPTGAFLYVVDQAPSIRNQPAILLAYSFDSETGILTAVPNRNRELGINAGHPIVIARQ
jgi:6-phosphogluconolactonase (cycloisomerase 2 family)